MKKLGLIFMLMLCSLLGCAGNNTLVKFVKEGGLETRGLVNLALASNGATVVVSQENPDRPAVNLIDGITSSENWDQKEGWEIQYEGFLARGEYIGYGVEDPMVVMDRLRDPNRDDDSGPDESFDPGDQSWRGLRVQTRFGNVDTSMGWVIVEFPEERLVNRAIIYTVDSEKYPAEKFGVADLVLQYWSNSANSWATVERIGKAKGQAGNHIEDNKSGVITIRFQPIETSKIRLIIRWTNDSKNFRRSYYPYTMGTIRLAEIEIYGYEKEKKEQIAPIDTAQNANKIAEIEVIVENYIDGYNKKDIDMLMSSISPEYSNNGETYSDLKKRIESIFAKYKTVKIELNDIRVKLAEGSATATSSYKLQYEPAEDTSSRVTASGILVFNVLNSGGQWKITRINSQ